MMRGIDNLEPSADKGTKWLIAEDLLLTLSLVPFSGSYSTSLLID